MTHCSPASSAAAEHTASRLVARDPNWALLSRRAGSRWSSSVPSAVPPESYAAGTEPCLVVSDGGSRCRSWVRVLGGLVCCRPPRGPGAEHVLQSVAGADGQPANDPGCATLTSPWPQQTTCSPRQVLAVSRSSAAGFRQDLSGGGLPTRKACNPWSARRPPRRPSQPKKASTSAA